VPSPLDEAIKFDLATGHYYPILYFNTYWNLASQYMPINETVPITNLTVTYGKSLLLRGLDAIVVDFNETL